MNPYWNVNKNLYYLVGSIFPVLLTLKSIKINLAENQLLIKIYLITSQFFDWINNMLFPFKLIDLTHTIDNHIPTWDAGCGFSQHIQTDYDDCKGDTKFRAMKMQMPSGIGTHMDAPSHCIQNGTYIHEFKLEDLCMFCYVIDVSNKAHERYSVTASNITDFETNHGAIQKHSCVMIKTGWEKFWGNPEKYRNNLVFPSVSIDAANIFLERDIMALGIDTLSPDRPEDGFKVHQAFLSEGKILLENVANLDNMPASGAFVMALPIKVKDATEAPIRLVGLT